MESSTEELRFNVQLSKLLVKNCLYHLTPSSNGLNLANLELIWESIVLNSPQGDHLRLRVIKEELA